MSKEKILEQTADPELKTKIYDIIVITMCVPDVKDATPFTPIIDIVKGMSSIPDINLLLIIGEDDKNILDSITRKRNELVMEISSDSDFNSKIAEYVVDRIGKEEEEDEFKKKLKSFFAINHFLLPLPSLKKRIIENSD